MGVTGGGRKLSGDWGVALRAEKESNMVQRQRGKGGATGDKYRRRATDRMLISV